MSKYLYDTLKTYRSEANLCIRVLTSGHWWLRGRSSCYSKEKTLEYYLILKKCNYIFIETNRCLLQNFVVSSNVIVVLYHNNDIILSTHSRNIEIKLRFV